MESPKPKQSIKGKNGSYLFLLLVEVVNNHTNEEVEGEEGAKYDENNEVDVHVDVDFVVGLVFHLAGRHNVEGSVVLYEHNLKKYYDILGITHSLFWQELEKIDTIPVC